ncbi:MAG: type II toxin-antitoxin system mRNA interferase toxin, RelE/StbE family [Candidatus Methylumidiphilus alinenensis]|uniref:Type II toxin-antitoxin system mRNA interferase toxin, RelE/StbE family n=1 Tax=Candidatus Methylumidiphilus alinenensis TaxID=2202197 RepID=A0A2W4RUL2_9GAMM|nr:MAG: type II toxin-antitoxin system mRNA interferase toxin, RelE/StbE family [Candidatus Methylumidiphilus alinenensis]
MSYKLEFFSDAWKEWENLDATLKAQFKKKLHERLENPHVESAQLRHMTNCYKIKLRRSGYRLVYQVEEENLIVLIIAIGKRDHNKVYDAAAKRLT